MRGSLKRTPLATSASRPPVIPGLGLPIKVAGMLLVGVLISMAVFRGWRAWIVVAMVWIALGLLARIRVKRDHHAFRADWSWARSKALFADAVKWGGVTLRSFPHLSDKRGLTRRGIP